MSRYDYADPGTDPRYCDGLAPEPEIETCSACHGSGEVLSDRATMPVRCDECEGLGYLEVR